jgi:hypothetical protein
VTAGTVDYIRNTIAEIQRKNLLKEFKCHWTNADQNNTINSLSTDEIFIEVNKVIKILLSQMKRVCGCYLLKQIILRNFC